MVAKTVFSSGWKRLASWTVVGLIALPLASVVLKRSANAQEPVPRDARTPRTRPSDCPRANRLDPADDPCSVLERVHTILGRFSPSAVEYVQSVASDFNLEGNVRIQQSLLREDFIWQQRGLTPRQLDVMVFASVGLSLQDAERLLKELRQSLDRSPDPQVQKRLDRVTLFKAQALAFLLPLADELRATTDADLRFSF